MQQTKIFRNRSAGFTLIEVVIAIAILALVAAPILTLFAVSTRNTVISANMTAASYLCQQKMEEWIDKDYLSLLEASKEFYKEDTNELRMISGQIEDYPGLAYTVKIRPSGVHSNLFGNEIKVQYAHLIFYNVTDSIKPSLTLFTPDGRFANYSSAGAQIELSAINGQTHLSHQLTWQGQSIPFSFLFDHERPVIFLTNFSYLKDESLPTLIDISDSSLDPLPGFVLYSDSESKSELLTVSPLPFSNQILYFTGGDSYNTMLVTIEISVYLIQTDGVTLLLADMVNTIPAKLFITS
jgi:prepilin-type N-terminal cleavage/methylation domain-containing protein